MKILILVQAVDERDPLFSFFVDWLKGASEVFEQITVLALRVGQYHLPNNVLVRPLRSASSHSRWEVIRTLLNESYRLRKDYDGVFVRGDAQYLVIAGWLWRLLGKTVIFWYTHYAAPSLWFWFGQRWANQVVTAVQASNPLQRRIVIGHHIDETAYHMIAEQRGPMKEPLRVLIFGRVSGVKRVPFLIQAVRPFLEAGQLQLTIAGQAASQEEEKAVKEAIGSLAVKWLSHSITRLEALDLYATHDLLLSGTPESMDKVILEAAASGVIVCTTTSALLEGLMVIDQWLFVRNEAELRGAIMRILRLSIQERDELKKRLQNWVHEAHSLRQHLARLAALFAVKQHFS